MRCLGISRNVHEVFIKAPTTVNIIAIPIDIHVPFL